MDHGETDSLWSSGLDNEYGTHFSELNVIFDAFLSYAFIRKPAAGMTNPACSQNQLKWIWANKGTEIRWWEYEIQYLKKKEQNIMAW